MPQRFGQASDYSQTFAYLAQQNNLAQEAAARRMDARREEELASRDALMNTRYNEGVISGDEWLAYIRRRINETSYDKAQQNKWRAAYAEYSKAIGDEQAEAQYALNDNIYALLSHYRTRLSQTKKGTPEYTALAQRVAQLREKRDAESLRAKANKMEREAAKGNKSTKELLQFYRGELSGLPAGDLRDSVQKKVSELAEQLRTERFTVAMQKVDSALAAGDMSPLEAGNKQQAILDQFGIRNRDPEAYWQWQEQIRATKATPDPVEIQKYENLLLNDKITPEQYRAKVAEWANGISQYDQAAAWQLLTEADKVLAEGAGGELENPDALGLPSGGSSSPYWSGTVDVARKAIGDIKHITQNDNSRYSAYNCTMAAGAMLAHSMGVTGLSGGDLRHLSGVTNNATNISQLQSALRQVGIDNTNLFFDREVGFNQFKKRLSKGATAVLSGWNGDIPQQFNASGIIAGHGIFVAGYKEGKGFLVMDPAKTNDKGTWWPEWVLRDFGWQGQRHGDALFSPRGTVDPATLKRTGGRVVHVSVNDRPQRADTPSSYHGQFDPGPDKQNQLIKAEKAKQRRENQRLNRRLKAAGIDPEIDTKKEVEQALQKRERSYMAGMEVIDKFMEEWNGEDGRVGVTIGGSTQYLSPEDIQGMVENLVYVNDGQRLFYEALGNDAGMRQTRQNRKDLIELGKGINTYARDEAEEMISADLNKVLSEYADATDPSKKSRLFGEALEYLVSLGNFEDDEESEEETRDKGLDKGSKQSQTEAEQDADTIRTDVTDAEKQENAAIAQILEAVMDPELSPEERNQAVADIVEQFEIDVPEGWPGGRVNPATGTPMGQGIAGLTTAMNQQWLTDPQYGEVVDPVTGNPLPRAAWILSGGELEVAKVKYQNVTDPETGAPMTPRGLLDLSAFDDTDALADAGINSAFDVPMATMRQYGEVRPVYVLPDTIEVPGVTFAQVSTDNDERDQFNAATGLKKKPGEFLTNDEISEIYANNPRAMEELSRQGLVTAHPWQVQSYALPERDGSRTPYYRDPGTGQWWGGTIPWDIPANTHTFVGVDSDTPLVNGRPNPDLEFNAEKQGVIPPTSMPKQQGISAKEAQKWHDATPWLDSRLYRDPETGEIVQLDETSEQYNNQYQDNEYATYVQRYKEETLRALDEARAQDPEAEERENRSFGEIFQDNVVSLRDRAMAIGFDPFKPETRQESTQTPDDKPWVDLEAFGVKKSSQDKKEEEPKTYQPETDIAAKKVASREKLRAQQTPKPKLSIPKVESKASRQSKYGPRVDKPEPKTESSYTPVPFTGAPSGNTSGTTETTTKTTTSPHKPRIL